MKKFQIIKNTLQNGNVEYQVKKNTIFGIPTPWWFPDFESTELGTFSTVFNTLEQAESYVKNQRTKIVNKEIIETYD
jgi:hypothetical protein